MMIEQLEKEDNRNHSASAGANADCETLKKSKDGKLDRQTVQAELQHHYNSIREDMEKRNQDTQQQLDEVKSMMNLILSALTSCGVALPNQLSTAGGRDISAIHHSNTAASAAPPQHNVGDETRRKQWNGPLDDNGMLAALCFPADFFLSTSAGPPPST